MTGHYYLNGNWRIDFPREMKFAGATFHYERRPHAFVAPETIRCLGPITEALYVVLLYQETNPGIEYEYSFPKGVSLPATQVNSRTCDCRAAPYFYPNSRTYDCNVAPRSSMYKQM